MMITKIGKALAVIGALALLAMPARALAQEGESRHEKQLDPERRLEKEHNKDRGRHLGWDKQHQDRDDDEWYQGQRGHWYKEDNRWQWRAYGGDRDYDKGERARYGMSPAELQRRQGLVNQDRMDRKRYRAALKRGDKEAAEHYLKQLNSTDKMLGMTQEQINAGMRPYADGRIGK